MRLVKQIIAKIVWSQSTEVYHTQTPLTECPMDKFESRINSPTICTVVRTTTSKNNETGETPKLFSVLDLYNCTSMLIGNVHACSCPNTISQYSNEKKQWIVLCDVVFRTVFLLLVPSCRPSKVLRNAASFHGSNTCQVAGATHPLT